MTATQTQPQIVSRDEWLKARLAHLEAEKEFTRKRDELCRERRELPWERVEKEYVFEGPRAANIGRALRRPQPTSHLSLHVGTELGTRMQELLVSGGPFRPDADSSGTSRRGVCSSFRGADAAHRGVSEAHGLAVPLSRHSARSSNGTTACTSAKRSWRAK